MPDWEVEEALDDRERYGKAQSVEKCRGYPNSDNSWEQLECHENTMDLVQAWWTNNMPGDEFPVESGFITMSYTPTTPTWTQFKHGRPIDSDFFKPCFASEYDYSGSEDCRVITSGI